MAQEQDKAQPTPAEQWSAEADKRALDELFTSVGRYSSSHELAELVEFTRRFKHYSPYNALLVHAQKSGATYVLRASEWRSRYERWIKPGAHPLVALQPMGPVMFLYDVSDTEGKALPAEVTAPFEPKGNLVGKELERTLDNCARDGICVHRVEQGSQSAGSIQAVTAKPGKTLPFREKPVPVRYELILNANPSAPVGDLGAETPLLQVEALEDGGRDRVPDLNLQFVAFAVHLHPGGQGLVTDGAADDAITRLPRGNGQSGAASP